MMILLVSNSVFASGTNLTSAEDVVDNTIGKAEPLVNILIGVMLFLSIISSALEIFVMKKNPEERTKIMQSLPWVAFACGLGLAAGFIAKSMMFS
jgi:hypothetical protein